MQVTSDTASEFENKSVPACTCTAEQELARLGARIDKLIARANKAKQAVQTKARNLKDKGTAARKRGEAALHEMKHGLDKAWADLNQTWIDLRIGTERALQELSPEDSAADLENADAEPAPPVPCGCPRHRFGVDVNEDVELFV